MHAAHPPSCSTAPYGCPVQRGVHLACGLCANLTRAHGSGSHQQQLRRRPWGTLDTCGCRGLLGYDCLRPAPHNGSGLALRVGGRALAELGGFLGSVGSAEEIAALTRFGYVAGGFARRVSLCTSSRGGVRGEVGYAGGLAWAGLSWGWVVLSYAYLIYLILSPTLTDIHQNSPLWFFQAAKLDAVVSVKMALSFAFAAVLGHRVCRSIVPNVQEDWCDTNRYYYCRMHDCPTGYHPIHISGARRGVLESRTLR